MIQPKRIASVAAVALLTGALVTACSSSKSSNSPGNGSPSGDGSTLTSQTGTSAATGSPIKVGTIVPLTGAGPQYPEILAGAKAAVKGINARGGINGHPLELVSCDDQNNQNQGLVCARKMISAHVVALVGNYGNYGPQETPLLSSAGIPEIGEATVFASSQYNSPNEFMLDAGTFTQFDPQISYAANTLKFTKIGCVAAAVEIADAICNTAKSAVNTLNLTWSGTKNIPVTATGYAPYVAATVSSGAQFVDMADSAEAVIQYALSAEQSGATFHLGISALSNTSADLQNYHPSSAFAQDMLFGSPVPPVSAAAKFPLLNTFQSDMSAEANSGDSHASTSSYSIGQEQEWFAFYAFEQVAKLDTSSTTSASNLMSTLKSAKNVQLGLIPPWTPSKQGPKNFSRVSEPYGYVLGVKDGEYTLASPKPIDLTKFMETAKGI